jgi:hypothetical protein
MKATSYTNRGRLHIKLTKLQPAWARQEPTAGHTRHIGLCRGLKITEACIRPAARIPSPPSYMDLHATPWSKWRSRKSTLRRRRYTTSGTADHGLRHDAHIYNCLRCPYCMHGLTVDVNQHRLYQQHICEVIHECRLRRCHYTCATDRITGAGGREGTALYDQLID